MGLESATEKLDKYFRRLEKGKAQKIKPDHVEKILRKLDAKAASLRAEIAESDKPDKQQRLERKLQLVGEQQERARWLQEEINKE